MTRTRFVGAAAVVAAPIFVSVGTAYGAGVLGGANDNEPFSLPQTVSESSDVNCSGGTDPVDALTVLRDNAGLSVNLPSGCLGVTDRVARQPVFTENGTIYADGQGQLWGLTEV
ncbi:MAG TPA: hypothetical protein VMR52_10330 [Dehalococcoidia bacterium]|nr:hypothetical protein [Dehalococcoidia bacterium]